MAHGSLCEFDLKKESIKDFHEHFEFYCVANGIQDDNVAKKKAMFIMLLGQETFAKLKVLASPTTMDDLTLVIIVQLLTQHFHPATIEIAKQFKFLSRIRKNMSPLLNTWGSCTDWAECAILVCILKRHFGTNLFVI